MIIAIRDIAMKMIVLRYFTYIISPYDIPALLDHKPTTGGVIVTTGHTYRSSELFRSSRMPAAYLARIRQSCRFGTVPFGSLQCVVQDAEHRFNMCIFEEPPVAPLPLLDGVEFVEHDQVPTFMPLNNEERSEIAREPSSQTTFAVAIPI